MKKISRTAKFLALLVSFVTPLFAAAQINTTIIKGYSDSIIGIINTILVPVLIAIAFITFLWGVYKYFILGADNETQRETGRQFTLWGIIGFVIILSLWGIVNLFMGTLGLSVGTAPKFPTIGGSTGVTNTTGTTVLPGAGGTTLGNTGGVTAAQTAYNTCIGGSNSNAQCQAVYAAAGGTGTATSVDTTKEANCNDSGGTYNTSSNTCDCSTMGGTWNGNTCTTNNTSTAQVNCEDRGGTWSNGTCSSATGGVGTCAGKAVRDSCDGGTGTCGYDYSATGTGNPYNTPLTCLAGYSPSSSGSSGASTGIQSGGDCTYNPNGCATGLSCITDASDVGTCQ